MLTDAEKEAELSRIQMTFSEIMQEHNNDRGLEVN
jgi:hypothetical protein